MNKILVCIVLLFAQVGGGIVTSLILGKSLWTTTLKSSSILMAAEATENKLTAADIVARSRKALGMETEEDEAPRIFSDDIYDYIKESLLLLEKRVKEGPRSLTVQEVNDLMEMTRLISKEMKEFDPRASLVSQTPVGSLPQTTVADTPKNPLFLEAPTARDFSAEATLAANSLTSSRPTETMVPNNLSTNKAEVYDLSEEGGDYDGTGGLGMAKGTRSTYVIPGMSEMSPEEYRAELQRTVIARQEERRASRRGVIGNRAAHDYLNTLGYGGVSKSLSVGKVDNEKKADNNFNPFKSDKRQ